MDEDTKLAALKDHVTQQMEEFERLVPRLRALGDVYVSIPTEMIDDICRPVTIAALPMPAFALRA